MLVFESVSHSRFHNGMVEAWGPSLWSKDQQGSDHRKMEPSVPVAAHQVKKGGIQPFLKEWDRWKQPGKIRICGNDNSK